MVMLLHALPTVVGNWLYFPWFKRWNDLGKTLIDVEGPAEKIAEILKDEKDLYLLAKGPAAAIAK